MKKLKNFEKLPEGERLKTEFDEKEFDYLHIIATLKHNLTSDNIEYKNGKKPSFSSLFYETREEIENIFGLVNITGNTIDTYEGEFAASFINNTEPTTKNLDKVLTLFCVAITETRKSVLIFLDENEKPYFFVETEFAEFAEQEKARQNAIKEGETIQKANAYLILIKNILKKYNGKTYGPKTRDNIHQEIQKAGEPFGLWAYIETTKKVFDNGSYCYLYILHKGNYTKKLWRPFEFLPTSNTINADNLQDVKEFDEFDGQKIYNQREKLKKEINQKAKTLLELVELYNDASDKINKRKKDTDTTAFNLYAIGKYGINENE